MELFHYAVFAVVFISAYFMFYTYDVYFRGLNAGAMDVNLLVLFFLFLIVILTAFSFLFARLPRYYTNSVALQRDGE